MRGRVVPPGARRRRDGLRRSFTDDAVHATGPGPDAPPLASEAPTTVRDAVALAESALDAAGVGESVADARLLVAHALGASPTWVFTHEPDALPSDAWPRIAALVERRSRREPLQHLLGLQEFWSLRLAVSPRALIPRPETEVLVEAALAALRGVASPRIADIGTGTGALAVALASEIPSARIVAVDASEEALDLAARNVRELGFEDRIELRLGDLVEPLRGSAPFDAMVANLPYVTEAEWEALEPEVRDFEPRLALVGGPDGLDLVRELIAGAPAVLATDGWLGLEIGAGQADAVRDLLAAWRDVEIRQDFAGIERVVSARRASHR